MLTLLLATLASAGALSGEDWLQLLEQPLESDQVQAVLEDRYYRFESRRGGVTVKRRFFQSDKRGVLISVDDDRVTGVSFYFSRDGKRRPFRGELPLGLADVVTSESDVPFEPISLSEQHAVVGEHRVDRWGHLDAKPWSYKVWRQDTAEAFDIALAQAEAKTVSYSDAHSSGGSSAVAVPAPEPDLDPAEAASVATSVFEKQGLTMVSTKSVIVGDGSPARESWRVAPGRLHHFFVYYRDGETTRMNVTAFSAQTTDAPNGRLAGTESGVSIMHLNFTTDVVRDVVVRVEPLYSRDVEAVVVYMTGPLSELE